MARMKDRQSAYLVTTAATSPDDDRRSRERRYLIMMGARVVAIGAAIAVGQLLHSTPLLILLIIAAMILPWLAVIIANAGPQRAPTEAPQLYSPHHRQIGGPADDASTSNRSGDHAA